MSRGALVISFDFELAWADRRGPGLGHCDPALSRTRDVVLRLLVILDRYKISATWATVGHLMLQAEDCPGGRFQYDLPTPSYPWFHGGWYEGIPAYGEDGWQLYYAPDMVEKIVGCPTYQELATHTFSHIQVGRTGCSLEVTQAELALCQQLACRWGRTFHSVVFPHNNAGHLAALEETGYSSYRGLNSEWYWFGFDTNRILNWLPSKLAVQPFRYIDERVPLCPPLPAVRRVGQLWEIPHSMFFPGYHGISKYVSARDRARRGIRGLRRAAERGRLFSLWTHPENLIHGTDDLLTAFEEICREAAKLRDANQIDILPMEQVAQCLDAGDKSWLN